MRKTNVCQKKTKNVNILINIYPKFALRLPYPCSMVAHGPLMGLSWDAHRMLIGCSYPKDYDNPMTVL